MTAQEIDPRTKAFTALAAQYRARAHSTLALSAEAHEKAMTLLEIASQMLTQSAQWQARAERAEALLRDDLQTNPTQPTK